MMLTISGGAWRGRKLKAIEHPSLRPTSSRVKASIFSILESMEWKRSGKPDFSQWLCLDLFAGVGGLGLEMLSRGAQNCVFVESNRRHAQVLRENIQGLGCESSSRILISDVFKQDWLGLGPFDLILMDPPYSKSELPDLLKQIGAGNCLKRGGILLFEHDPENKPAEVPGLSLSSQRVLGPAGISVFLKN